MDRISSISQEREVGQFAEDILLQASSSSIEAGYTWYKAVEISGRTSNTKAKVTVVKFLWFFISSWECAVAPYKAVHISLGITSKIRLWYQQAHQCSSLASQITVEKAKLSIQYSKGQNSHIYQIIYHIIPQYIYCGIYFCQCPQARLSNVKSYTQAPKVSFFPLQRLHMFIQRNSVWSSIILKELKYPAHLHWKGPVGVSPALIRMPSRHFHGGIPADPEELEKSSGFLRGWFAVKHLYGW